MTGFPGAIRYPNSISIGYLDKENDMHMYVNKIRLYICIRL